jgi:hypothetical protein
MSPRKRSRPTMQTDVLNFTVIALEWAVPAPCCDARTEIPLRIQHLPMETCKTCFKCCEGIVHPSTPP